MTPRYCGAAVLALALVGLGGTQKQDPPPKEPTPILPAEPAWSILLDAPPAAGGDMDAQRVFVPIQGGGVRALSRETGELVWSVLADVTQPPLALEDAVVVAGAGDLRSLDPASGAERWHARLPAAAAAQPVAVGGVLVVPTEAGFAGFDRRDGSLRWQRATGATAGHPLALLEGNRVVATMAGGSVVAIDPSTGETVWERKLPGALSAPAAARDRVFVGSTNNFFYALDGRTGRHRWRWRTGADVVGAAADGDRVYFVSLDNVLRAVNRSNGNQVWKKALPTRPALPPVAFGDVVVVAGVASTLEAFVGKTGAPLGSYAAPSDLQGVPLIDTAPAPFQVAIVVLMRDGRLAALRPTRLMFPDPALVPFRELPGRALPSERLVFPTLPRPTVPRPH